MARAKKPPVTLAVRVPPSPCSTSQSTVMVMSGSMVKSTAERGDSFSLDTSRRERSRLARGSMEYSAVTQPVPSATCRGAVISTLAQHSTLVLPQVMRTLPSGNLTKLVSM